MAIDKKCKVKALKEKARILFVQPPITGFHRNQMPTLTFSICRIPPLSGITLAAYLRKHGHKTAVIDGNRIAWRFGNIPRLTYQEVLRKALHFRPDIIAVTILTANFHESRETIQKLRNTLPNVKIYAGGVHPSGESVVTLEQIPELDGVGIGAGEDILLDLAERKEISETEGCAYRNGDEIILTKKRTVNRDIDSNPFLAYDLLDTDYYTELNSATTFGILTRSLSVLTSRGCSYQKCIFCASKWNRPLRLHSAEYVLDLCEHLAKKYPIDTIAFWDDTIGSVPKRLEALCEGFLRRKLNKKIKWFAHLRANQMSLDRLKMMREAGCFYVAFGAESFNERVLKVLNKGTTPDDNLAAAEMVNEAGLLLGTSVILGSPTETREEMKQTIKACMKLKTANLGVGRFCALVGSPSYDQFVREKKIDPRNVNWEILGNFSLMHPDAPCFANINPKEFTQIFTVFNRYCNCKNREAFIRNNMHAFPDIVRLYQQRKERSGFRHSALKVMRKILDR